MGVPFVFPVLNLPVLGWHVLFRFFFPPSIGRSFYLLGKDVFLFSHCWVWLVIGNQFSSEFGRHFFCLLRVQCGI